MRRLVVAAVAILLLLPLAGPASAAPPGKSGDHAPLYYLSLGDSLAGGEQPAPYGDPANGLRSHDGYADQLYLMAREAYPNLRHVKLGCTGGETTDSFMAGGVCPFEEGSQLAQAVEFLHAHRQFVAFVTIDIGINDFHCYELECVPHGVGSISANLPAILDALRQAAGPDTPIVGMTYYDPLLAAWLLGAEGQGRAMLSATMIHGVNQLLAGIYASRGMAVADVGGTFSTTDFTTLVPLPPFGDVPLNVARICQWTWVCTPYQNNHANAAGYLAMADTFAAILLP